MNRTLLRAGALLAIVLAVVVGVAAENEEEGQWVKKSKSGICHCPGGTYYERTSKFRPYRTIDKCLANGGRHPKRGQGDCTIVGPSLADHPGSPQSMMI